MKEKKKLQLSLNKRRISDLTNAQANKVEGGSGGGTYGYNCNVVSIDVRCYTQAPCNTDFSC